LPYYESVFHITLGVTKKMTNAAPIAFVVALNSGMALVAARVMVRSVQHLAAKTRGAVRDFLYLVVGLTMAAIVVLPSLWVLVNFLLAAFPGNHGIAVTAFVLILFIVAAPAFWYLFKNRGILYDAGYWKRWGG
jgi:hypothetical protein